MLNPGNTNFSPALTLRQSLAPAKNLTGSKSSLLTFFPEYRFKFLGYNRFFHSVFLIFYGKMGAGCCLPKNSVSETAWMKFSRMIIQDKRDHVSLTSFGVLELNGQC